MENFNGTVLLVEDSPKVQSYNSSMLEDEGFAVETAMTLADARAFLTRETAAAIILDIGMPDGSGLDFLRELRKTSKIPVLLLTGYGETKDIVAGFESGCDDYLPKPYTFDVLLVRLRHLLQNTKQMPETMTKGVMTLDILAGRAFIGGTDLLLTPKDFALLLLLSQNEDKILRPDDIYEKVWKMPLAGNSASIQTAVSRLRNKIAPSGYSINAIRGKGYVFERR